MQSKVKENKKNLLLLYWNLLELIFRLWKIKKRTDECFDYHLSIVNIFWIT